EGVKIDSGVQGLRPYLDAVFGGGQVVLVQRVPENIVNHNLCVDLLVQDMVVDIGNIRDRIGINVMQDNVGVGKDVLPCAGLLDGEIQVKFEVFGGVITVKYLILRRTDSVGQPCVQADLN